MAALRPFRGLRYTPTAGALESLVSPTTGTLTPNQREEFANRSPLNVVAVASPEGHGDDRSKYVRYARSAARLAEWRREGHVAPQDKPAFYRLSQPMGTTADGDLLVHTTLLAVAGLADNVFPVEAADPRAREERLRLLEATRTTFEPALAYYEDPTGTGLHAIRSATASSEAAIGTTTLETIDDPYEMERIVAVFRDRTLLVADGVEGFEAARSFRESLGTRQGPVPEDGTLIALASLDAPSTARRPLHRVVRRLPTGGDRNALLARLATLFSVEEHHNRNLPIHLERSENSGQTAFGLATEGGLGYLLTPLSPIEGPAAAWLQREIFDRLLGISANDPVLYIGDAVHAVRAADEGAAAAFLLPRPLRSDIIETHRGGLTLPYRSSAADPGVPTGLVMWAMGDDA